MTANYPDVEIRRTSFYVAPESAAAALEYVTLFVEDSPTYPLSPAP